MPFFSRTMVHCCHLNRSIAMKLIARLFAAILFILFFGFALKNAHEVNLRFFLGNEWHTPLALLLLAFFAAGAFLGVLAMLPTLFRKRRELNKSKSALLALQKERDEQASTHKPPLQPDTTVAL
jgi:lipopolysaccharide assembly protein A